MVPRTPRTVSRAADDGFTLIELLVATAIAATLAAAALPAWSELRANARLESATRQLVVALDEARVRAVADNLDHLIRVTPGGGRYHHLSLDEHGAQRSDLPSDLPAGILVADCTAPNDEVRYTSRGSAASFGTIRLQDAHGGQRRIVVSITGRIRTSR